MPYFEKLRSEISAMQFNTFNSTMHVLYSRRKDLTTSRRYSEDYNGQKVPERIQFRLGVLTYRCLHNTAPSYLAESLQLAAEWYRCLTTSSYTADSMTLVVPTTRCSTVGDRAFPLSAARTWNALPSVVRATSSLAVFRKKIKRTLFQSPFPDDWFRSRDVFVQCPCNSLTEILSL